MATEIKKQQPPRGKFVIRENESGEPKYSIVLQYVVHSLIAKTTFGTRISRDQWNEQKQCVVKHPQAARLNDMLAKFHAEYNALILDYFKKKQHINIKELRYILTNKRMPDEAANVVEMAIEMLKTEKMQNRISASTYANNVTAMKGFMDFWGGKYPDKPLPETLTPDIVEAYISWRLTVRNNSVETINKALTPLIRVSERLRNSGKISAEVHHKISQMYLPKEKRSLAASNMVADKVEFITHDQFGKLLEYQETKATSRASEYIDMFAFATFTGMRWSDIVTLEWGHIDWENCIISKVLVKGKRDRNHIVPLDNHALCILDKWHDKTGNGRFVFGLLENDAHLDDDDFLRTATQSKARSMLAILSKVATTLDFPSLHFHMARHTFAIWALNDGRLTLPAIASILGHSSVTTTENFYAKYIVNYNRTA